MFHPALGPGGRHPSGDQIHSPGALNAPSEIRLPLRRSDSPSRNFEDPSGDQIPPPGVLNVPLEIRFALPEF